LNKQIKDLSSQIPNSREANDLIQNQVNNLQKQNQSLLKENEELKNQFEDEKQLNENFQNKIQEKQQLHQILTNLVDDLTNQCKGINLEKEQIKIDYEQQLLECSQKLEQSENDKQEQQEKFADLKDKIELDHNQHQIKLEEYLLAPPSVDPNQEEADQSRFLFLSYLSNLHHTQEIHDYFQSTLDDENNFEEFF
jgi:chromosome segregation ATPase